MNLTNVNQTLIKINDHFWWRTKWDYPHSVTKQKTYTCLNIVLILYKLYQNE
jgi:hypothetical protein